MRVRRRGRTWGDDKGSIELDAKRGTFKSRIEATGAYGTTRVAYDGDAWQVTSSRVTKP
jgi:hypothetical protein